MFFENVFIFLFHLVLDFVRVLLLLLLFLFCFNVSLELINFTNVTQNLSAKKKRSTTDVSREAFLSIQMCSRRAWTYHNCPTVENTRRLLC